MEHIFNQCPNSNIIWDQAAVIMRKEKDRTSVVNTIQNWGMGDFKIPLLNRIWHLIPGFIVWQLWKERNRHIFHSQSSTPSKIWSKIVDNIWETIQTQSWTPDDIPKEPLESIILSSWKKTTFKASLSLFLPLPLQHEVPPSGDVHPWVFGN
jgi:hypothetical protein